MHSPDSTPTAGSGWRSIVYGGLAVGVLDGLDAVIFFGARGVPVERIFQHIASALLGRPAFSMGGAAVAWGVLLHFAVAFCIATVFWLIVVRVPWVRRHWVKSGTLFGLLAYAGMNYAVVPLTRAAGAGGIPPWPVLLNGVLAHIFLVGLPLALVVNRQTRPRPAARAGA